MTSVSREIILATFLKAFSRLSDEDKDSIIGALRPDNMYSEEISEIMKELLSFLHKEIRDE